nr:hypothetical protein [Tanacetum cinerariifolium]
MASDHVSSDPVPKFPITALEHDSLSPDPQCQENVPHAAGTVTTSNELDLLFSLMFDELLNGSTHVVSKSSVVTTADAPNKLSRTKTKNIKEAMANSAWIESMQEELYQFDRLDRLKMVAGGSDGCVGEMMRMMLRVVVSMAAIWGSRGGDAMTFSRRWAAVVEVAVEVAVE